MMQLIEAYSLQAAPMPYVDLPPRELFRSTILSTGDSAAGFDGVPFAFLRLFPEKCADILINLLLQSFQAPHLVRSPNPLLVWIPKADAGLGADNWRHLGMPSTFLRILAALKFRHITNKCVGLLHPAQALLYNFREPQGNFWICRICWRVTTPNILATLLVVVFLSRIS